MSQSKSDDLKMNGYNFLKCDSSFAQFINSLISVEKFRKVIDDISKKGVDGYQLELCKTIAQLVNKTRSQVLSSEEQQKLDEKILFNILNSSLEKYRIDTREYLDSLYNIDILFDYKKVMHTKLSNIKRNHNADLYKIVKKYINNLIYAKVVKSYNESFFTIGNDRYFWLKSILETIKFELNMYGVEDIFQSYNIVH